MNGQELIITNKHIKCHIVKWANDIKLLWIKYVFWIKYVKKNALWTGERSKCSLCIVDNYSKIQKQLILQELLFPKLLKFKIVLIHCLGNLGGKIIIDNTTENIKCGNL